MNRFGVTLLLVLMLGFAMIGCSESIGGDAVSTAKVTATTDGGDDWLGLTDQQEQMICEIRQGYRDEFKALRDQYNDNRDSDEARAAFDAIRDKIHSEIADILTEEQRELWNAAQLTDQQREQIRVIRDSYEDKFAAARKECRESGTRGRECAALDALHEQMRAEIEPLLTETQLARFEARGDRGPGPGRMGFGGRGAEGMGRGPGGGQGRGPEGRVDRLAEQLDLTDDQQAQIQEIFDTMRENFAADCSGRPDEETRAAHRAEINEQISAILTPEQQELFDELKNNRPDRGQGKRGGRFGRRNRG